MADDRHGESPKWWKFITHGFPKRTSLDSVSLKTQYLYLITPKSKAKVCFLNLHTSGKYSRFNFSAIYNFHKNNKKNIL
jgi:hypothetical protein